MPFITCPSCGKTCSTKLEICPKCNASLIATETIADFELSPVAEQPMAFNPTVTSIEPTPAPAPGFPPIAPTSPQAEQQMPVANPYSAPVAPVPPPAFQPSAPNPYQAPANPYQAQSNPYQAPANPYQAQSNPYQAPANPYQAPTPAAPTTPSTPPTPPVPPTSFQHPYATPPAQGQHLGFCPQCGTMRQGNFCGRCGYRFSDGGTATPPPIPNAYR